MWEVDQIVERKKHYRKFYYFVMYKGYGVEDGEWILRSELMVDCPDLIDEFDQKFPDPGIATNKKPAKGRPRRSKAAYKS